MQKIAMAIHGGAGSDSDFIKQNKAAYENSLRNVIKKGYAIIEKGGAAIDAVEESVRELEDNYLFNAGRGSALNNKGEVEMDACIMNGKNLLAGAVSMVKNIKNPITLA